MSGWFKDGEIDFETPNSMAADSISLALRINGGKLDFQGATFSGVSAYFSGAHFVGGYVRFDRATFESGTVDFNHVEFGPSVASFTYASYGVGIADLRGCGGRSSHKGSAANLWQPRETADN